MAGKIADRERAIVSPITCVKRLSVSVYNLRRNAVSFQQRFPRSSFAEFAELLSVFVGEATIKPTFRSSGFDD